MRTAVWLLIASVVAIAALLSMVLMLAVLWDPTLPWWLGPPLGVTAGALGVFVASWFDHPPLYDR